MTGETFGPYRLESFLGRGGMGEVWRAVDTSQGDRVVALKVLRADLSGDDGLADRFRRESKLAGRLSGPNIVPIHRYGEHNGQLYIDMPLIDGIDMAKLLKRDGPLPRARAVGIVAQAAKALAVAHRAGLVHRDVKPTNIMVSDDGDDHVYLIDFGIVRAIDATRLSLSGALVGTPAYMAPEQFTGAGDHRADVWSLGCVLREALTGTRPFAKGNPLVSPAPRPSDLRPGIPPALDDVVATALAKGPGQRYQAVTDLAAAARQALATAPDHWAPQTTVLTDPAAARPAPRVAVPPDPAPAPDRSAPPAKASDVAEAQPSSTAGRGKSARSIFAGGDAVRLGVRAARIPGRPGRRERGGATRPRSRAAASRAGSTVADRGEGVGNGRSPRPGAVAARCRPASAPTLRQDSGATDGRGRSHEARDRAARAAGGARVGAIPACRLRSASPNGAGRRPAATLPPAGDRRPASRATRGHDSTPTTDASGSAHGDRHERPARRGPRDLHSS